MWIRYWIELTHRIFFWCIFRKGELAKKYLDHLRLASRPILEILYLPLPSGGSKGGAGDAPPPGVEILSISCSFWENSTNSYVGAPPGSWRPPPWGNPGSATATGTSRSRSRISTLSKVQKILRNATRSENTFQSFNIEVYENFSFS